MTVFYLIRHGEIVWAPGDPVLSSLGRSQSAAVGAFLADKGVRRVFTSPLLRAKQTAEIIALTLGIPLIVDPRLRERLNWGDQPDQDWSTFAAEFKRGDHDPNYVSPGGISASQAGLRFAQFLTETAQAHPGEANAAVTHGGILGDYLVDHLPAADLAGLHPQWSAQLADVIKHCSVTTLRFGEDGPGVEGLAVTIDQVLPKD